MATIFADTNQKGGVSKTLTSINLAAAAAQDESKNILVIDLDPQGHLTEGVGLSDLYLSEGDSIYDAIVPDPRRKTPVVLGDLIKPVPGEKFHCLPSNFMLQVAEKQLYPMNGREKQLDLLIEQIDDIFDEIYIDCPPNLGPLTDAAIFAARRGRGGLIVPVQCEKTSVKALELLSDQIELLERQYKGEGLKVDFLAIVPSIYRESNISSTILGQIKGAFPGVTTPFVIPHKVALPESYDQARSIFTYIPMIGDKSQKRKDAEELQKLFVQIVESARSKMVKAAA